MKACRFCAGIGDYHEENCNPKQYRINKGKAYGQLNRGANPGATKSRGDLSGAEPCNNFKAGKCQRGAQCRYAHAKPS